MAYVNIRVDRVGGDQEEMYIAGEDSRGSIWNFISYPYDGRQISSFINPGNRYVIDYTRKDCPQGYDGIVIGVSVP